MRGFLFLILLAATSRSVAMEPCAGVNRAVVARIDDHHLWLCEGGRAVGSYAISEGRGGGGKTRQGDLRTPKGSYSLGRLRASKRFHTFIPVGYPTSTQKAKGLTGGAVGIHGPVRTFALLGRVNTLFDWTQGCIAVGSDSEIEAIAKWVRLNPAATILIQ